MASEAVEKAPRASSKRVEIRHAKAPKANVILILQDAETGRVERIVEAHNIVTADGGAYYAQRGSTMVPTNTFYRGKIALASSYLVAEAGGAQTLNSLTFGGGTTGIQSFDATYPRVNDSDSDNTGAGVSILTYRTTYSTSEGNFTIKALGIARHDWITNPAGSAALRKILNYVTLPSPFITKTSSQTLKVFVNHTFTGV